MAIWHSFLLVGHYRIFRAMNTLTNYHRLEVKPKMELLMSYDIGSLKLVHNPDLRLFQLSASFKS